MRTVLLIVGLFAAGAASAQPPGPPGAAPGSAEAARLLSTGLDTLCSGFLRRPDASSAKLEALAAKAGFSPGASDPYGPVGQAIPGAPPALTFHADAGASSGGPEIIVHLTTVPGACQIRVKGDAAAWGVFLAKMPKRGGKLITAAPLTPQTTYSHEVYVGGIAGAPAGYTTFVNRWVGAGTPKNGVWAMINVLPNTGVSP